MNINFKIDFKKILKNLRDFKKNLPEFLENHGLFILLIIFILIIFYPAYIFYFDVWVAVREPVFAEEKSFELPKFLIDEIVTDLEKREKGFNEEIIFSSGFRDPFK